MASPHTVSALACVVAAIAVVSCASDGDADSPEVTTAVESTEAPAASEPNVETPATEAVATDAPTTEAPTTEAPTTEAPTTEAPTTEAPTTEAPTTDAEPSAPLSALSDSTVTIEDPTVGALTFDVRTAGDPAVAGDGRAVLLLHGFPETNRTWDTVSQELAAAGYYAVAINQRGYSAGARPDGVENYAVTHLVDDIFAVADELSLDTFHIVGHDFGSLVAWSVAGREVIEAPGRVTSLTTLSVGHPLAFIAARNSPTSDQGERSAYFEVFQAPDSQDLFLADDAAFYRGLFDGAYTDEELEVYLDVLGTTEAMSSILDWYRAIDIASPDSAQTITLPTLFMWSTGDEALGREQAETTADYVSGPYTFVEIPDVSHWIVHEATSEVTSALLAHLAAN